MRQPPTKERVLEPSQSATSPETVPLGGAEPGARKAGVRSPRQKSRIATWLVAGLIPCVAAGAIVVSRSHRDEGGHGSSVAVGEPLRSDAGVGPRPSSIDATGNVNAAATVDAGTADAGTADAGIADAGIAAPVPRRPRHNRTQPQPRPNASNEVAGVPLSSANIEALLSQARQALDATPQDSIRLANRVLLSNSNNLQALRIRVIAYCNLHDLGGAKTALNRLPEKSVIRKQVIAACARAGQPLE